MKNDSRHELAEAERIRIATGTGTIKFSSGRTMQPYYGIVGLSHKLEVCEGFDEKTCSAGHDDGAPKQDKRPYSGIYAQGKQYRSPQDAAPCGTAPEYGLFPNRPLARWCLRWCRRHTLNIFGTNRHCESS